MRDVTILGNFTVLETFELNNVQVDKGLMVGWIYFIEQIFVREVVK